MKTFSGLSRGNVDSVIYIDICNIIELKYKSLLIIEL